MDKIASPAPKKNEISGQGAELDSVSIIRKDAIKQGLNPDEILVKVNKLKQNPRVELVQFGNTVFLLQLVAPFTVEVHIFTSDNMMGVLQNYQKLADALKAQGIKKGYTYSDEPMFKKIVERSGMPVKITQTQKQIKGQMKPVYMYEMDL